MPAFAAFFDSLPGWLQVTISILVMVGTILAVWKGVIPLFFHRVPRFHRAAMYKRDQVVIRNGKPVVKGPGPRGAFPGVFSYQDTDTRQQLTSTDGFKVDIGTPATTYYVDGLSILWEVVDVYLFQSTIADAELFISKLVIQACRDTMASEGSVNLSMEVITGRCSRRIPTLSHAGVKLVSVMVTSGTHDTRNHRMMDGNDQSRKPIVMADEL
jgi:hypothetical protein